MSIQIDYKKNKLTNALALVAGHITILPLITTFLAYKCDYNRGERLNNKQPNLFFLSIGKFINTLLLTVGFIAATELVINHLVKTSKMSMGTGIACGISIPISFLFVTIVGVYCCLESINPIKCNDTLSEYKNGYIATNPISWPLVPVTLTLDKVINSCCGVSNKNMEDCYMVE